MKVLTGLSIKKENWEAIFEQDFMISKGCTIKFDKEDIFEVWSNKENEALTIITENKTIELEGKNIITYYEIQDERIDSETFDKDRFELIYQKEVPVEEVKDVFNIENSILNEPAKIQDIKFDKIFEIDTDDCIYFGFIMNNIAFIPVESNEDGDVTFRTSLLCDIERFITKEKDIEPGEICRFGNTNIMNVQNRTFNLLRYGSDKSINISRDDVNEIRQISDYAFIYKTDEKAYKVHTYNDISQKIYVFNEVELDSEEGKEIFKRKIIKKSNLSARNNNLFGFLSL